MADCFDCGKKFGWGENKFTLLEDANEIGIQDELANTMNATDNVCLDCLKKFQIRNALEYYKHFEKTMNPSDFKSFKENNDLREVVQKAEQLLAKQTSTKISSSTSNTITSSKDMVTKSTTNTTSTIQNTMDLTSADQLRALTSSKHDEFKSQWDKNGIVQFKNDRVAILKRMVGQQVQFIVAYDKVTEEGYRLMAIDEGITAQGSGFSGGASAYFYFQKMDYVR
jgi:hypothetical protein